MGAKTIAIMNMKGGVGKTTLTVALAESLSVMMQKSVLVIDLDAQASCTFALVGRRRMIELIGLGRNSFRLFSIFLDRIRAVTPVQDFEPLTATAEPIDAQRQPQPIGAANFIAAEASNIDSNPRPLLDLLPAVPEIQYIERQILYELGRRSAVQENPEEKIGRFFEEAITPLRARYDCIIVDCPPGISSFSAAAIRSADLVIAPVMPEYLSELGLSVFSERVLRVEKAQGRLRRPARVTFNRVLATPLHEQYIKSISEMVRQREDVLAMLDVRIPQDTALADVSSRGDIVMTIRSKYGASIPILEELVLEVSKLVGANE